MLLNLTLLLEGVKRRRSSYPNPTSTVLFDDYGTASMSITLDVYGLTDQRSLETVNAFVAQYCDRAAIEDLGDSALMILRTDATDPDRADAYEFQPVASLSQAIAVGLEHPTRAFSLYLPAQESTIDQVVLSFCRDRQLVLGLTLPDRDCAPKQAQTFLQDWATRYRCSRGLIGLEAPPPLDAADFERAAQRSLLTLFVGLCQPIDQIRAAWPSSDASPSSHGSRNQRC